MNYSTLKKTAALSVAALLTAGMVSAQTTTTTTSADSTMSSGTTTAKVFGGRGQYKTFSIGVNAGVTSPFLAIGGTNEWTNADVSLGYGLSFRSQLAHSFGLQLDLHGGKVRAHNEDAAGNPTAFGNRAGYSTKFYSATLSGVVNVATIDYIRRKNAINFFITAGGGLSFYQPSVATSLADYNSGTYQFYRSDANGNPTSIGIPDATNKKRTVKELVIPIGVGVKFKLTDAVALNLGYTMNFLDGNNFDASYSAAKPQARDKYSYGYGGLEFTLGGKGKPNLDWVNPVAMMYDELYDETLRQEVAALKVRVTNVENAVNDLKKDSDGDGVSDQFDKCPNTPAGSVVDGSGCVLVINPIPPIPVPDPVIPYSNIQFEFDSSVLRTSSYPVLDATSADLRAKGATVQINGYASSEGTPAHNMSLSRDRANSVKTYLVNSGVAASNVKVKAYGETNPIADNSTEEGRVQNRRVSFIKK
ncbi:OmpA family protein [Mucilaginibacter psychrotolerans]|uniref:OmpA family protein n=1 Tax=Mucilaginibacter psychrotolerans TaxID=1524096 RepID=A0A4Y8S8K0_9SPHI|nr:OmpA family protein [Mucilaginibacter psychrotolerans]TFF34817.1 OmpA family protein [Mucilaginibacter psychrotolerans]